MEPHPLHGKKMVYVDHDSKKSPATVTGVWPDGKITLMLESGLTVENVQVVQPGQETARSCYLET